MLTNEVVNQALNIVGVSDSVTESPEPEDAAKGIKALNSVITSLNGDYKSIPNYSFVNFDVFKGINEYTFGVGDDFDVNLESKILDYAQHGHLRRANTDWPVSVYDYDWFMSVLSINSSSIPQAMLLKRFNESWTLRFYYKPDSDYFGTLRVKQALPEAELNQDIDVPSETVQFFVYKTAFYLGNFYGKSLNKQQLEVLRDLEGDYQRRCQIDNSSVKKSGRHGAAFSWQLTTSGWGAIK